MNITFFKYFLGGMVLLVLMTTKSVLAVLETDGENGDVTSYELFWPVVSGKVRGETLYPLKQFRERLLGLLVFNKTKKAEFYSIISTKRLVEYEDLVLNKRDFSNSILTLGDLINTQKKVFNYLTNNNKNDINYTEASKIVLDTFNRQLLLLNSISNKADSSQSEIILNAKSFLSSEIEKIK